MPWQRYWADVVGEVDDDGVPYYREAGLTVPRQSGKTTIILAKAIDRVLLGESQPSRVIYTAQTGQDARAKLLEDMYEAMIEPSDLDALVKRVYKAKGEEQIVWRTGGRIALMASGEAAGHGKTVDEGFIDEAFADYDSRREQSLNPGMATKPRAQLHWLSTAGTDESAYLIRKVELGRRAADEDTGEGLCYFEWSADPESDRADEDEWHRFHPALGHTVQLAAMRHAHRSLPADEFDRAWRNLWTKGKVTVIPPAVWSALLAPHHAPNPKKLTFGLDVNSDRTAAAIVAADPAGNLELVEYRTGLDWVLDHCNMLSSRFGADVAVDSGGPASGFITGLRRPAEVGSADMARACAKWFDDVIGQVLKVRDANVRPLTLAVSGATKKKLGDRFVWSRTAATEDASPMLAASIAYWVALNPPKRQSRAAVHSF